MTEAPVITRTLTPVDGPTFEALWSIYSEAIPARERKSRALIEGLLTRPDYRILVLEQNEQVLGFSILFMPAQATCFLLEYLAIHQAHRQGGHGEALLNLSFQAGFADPDRITCLIEVEAPLTGHSEWASQVKRQRFYRRHGCRIIDGLSYLLPLPGDTPAPPMNLLARFQKPRDRVSRAELAGWLRAIYSGAYGCLADDSRLAFMLGTIADSALLI